MEIMENKEELEESELEEEQEPKVQVITIDAGMLKRIDEKVKEFIAKMVLKNIFWGYVFAQVHRKPEFGLKSVMGVGPNKDGTITLYYNPIILDMTDDESLLKVIEHEGMHLINKHIPRLIRIFAGEVDERKKKFKSEVWNIASDAAANVQMKMPKTINIGGKEVNLVFPENFDMPKDKASEWYYDSLLQNNVVKVPMPCPSCGGSGEVKPDDGDGGDKDEDGDGSGQGNGQGKEKQRCPDCGGNGNAGGEGSGGIDDHSQWSDAEAGDPNALARKVEMNTTSLVREAAKAQKSRGTIPGHIAELIEEFLRPPALPYHL